MTKLKVQTSLLLRYWVRFGLIQGFLIFCSNRFFQDLTQIRLSNLIYPITLRAGSSDVNVFDQMFLFREYQLFLNYSPKFILDLGAHIGLATLWFVREFPGAKIVSVEPDIQNYALLVSNTKHYSQVKSINSAVWSESCHLKVLSSAGGSWANQVSPCSSTEPDNFVSISIPEILMQSAVEEIDILKIDIETAEKEVFSKGAEDWLPKVKVLFIELHDIVSPGCSKAVLKAISQYEFSCFPRGEGLLFIRNDMMEQIKF